MPEKAHDRENQLNRNGQKNPGTNRGSLFGGGPIGFAFGAGLPHCPVSGCVASSSRASGNGGGTRWRRPKEEVSTGR